MICHSCGASIPAGQKTCDYCGAARPRPPVGDVGKAGFACPQCHGPLVKVPEKRDYYVTVEEYTEAAQKLQAQHQADRERVVTAHKGKFGHYYNSGCAVAVVGFILLLLTGESRFFGWVWGLGMGAGLLYAGYGWLVMTFTMPKAPPLPPGAEEMEDKEVLDDTHTGMMLKCRGCDWEDWAYNYDEAAQQQVAEAQRQSEAAERAALAAEQQAFAQQQQAAAEWERLQDERSRHRNQ